MQNHRKTSQSQDDYLEAILLTISQKGFCRSIDLANRLGYATSSVSIAVGRLEQAGLIRRGASSELLLTQEGRAIAESVYEKHRFFTAWLISIGVSEKTAAEDACRLEHAISDASFRTLKAHINASDHS